jgi:putative transposase
MVRYIDDYKGRFGVEPICRVLPIAPSTYYEHKAREADPLRRPARWHRDEALKLEIVRIWHEHKEVYGAYKVWKQLHRESIPAARWKISAYEPDHRTGISFCTGIRSSTGRLHKRH